MFSVEIDYEALECHSMGFNFILKIISLNQDNYYMSLSIGELIMYKYCYWKTSYTTDQPIINNLQLPIFLAL